MATGHVHAKALFPAIGSVFLACLFACPAPAGDDVRVVPVYSDGRGSQAWVEIDSAGERMKATPFVAVGGDGLRKALEKPEGKGSLAVPVPRLMRLVERARRAMRDMKRPAAQTPAGPDVVTAASVGPAGPVGESREAPPDRAGSSAPPRETDTVIRPPDLLYSTATR